MFNVVLNNKLISNHWQLWFCSAVLLLIQTIVNVCFAQISNQQDLSRISGRINEIYTNNPISYVSVTVMGTDIQTTSNDSGFYELKNIEPGIYSLQVSMIGYKKVIKDNIRIESSKDYNFNFTLSDIWECYKYIDSAKNDIQNQNAKILIVGLIIITEPRIPEGDIKEITKRYGFEYAYVGCTFTCSGEYNKIIYQYLAERNGDDWEERLNEEIKFLKESFQK